MIDYIQLENLENRLKLFLKEIENLKEASKNDPAPIIPKEFKNVEGKSFIKQGDKEIFATEIEDYTKVDFYHGKNLKFGELVPEDKKYNWKGIQLRRK